jgi:hypothetical protein
MAKFFIPDVGFRLRLTNDTTMSLLNTYDNFGIIRADPKRDKVFQGVRAGHEFYAWTKEFTDVELLAGTILSVARVYIRKGAADYSSVTFNIIESPQKIFTLKTKGGIWDGGLRRFFLHIDYVNQLEFEAV